MTTTPKRSSEKKRKHKHHHRSGERDKTPTSHKSRERTPMNTSAIKNNED